MPRTVILEPLKENEISEEISKTLKEKYKNIKDLMLIYSKSKESFSFETTLKKLNITEEEYMITIRSSLKRPQVFLKRESNAVCINPYNKTILYLFECNMDIQFILDEYGIASYIVKYISKVDSGLSKVLRDAELDAKNGNKSIKEKFSCIANKFLNSNLMSSQEAAYHVLSLPLSKCSRRSIFINTSPRQERVRMLKHKNQLKDLDTNDTHIYMEDIFEKYAKRNHDLEDICLAQFASEYAKQKTDKDDCDFAEDNPDCLESEKYYLKKKDPSLGTEGINLTRTQQIFLENKFYSFYHIVTKLRKLKQ
jgi:hypothetical protein